jgi:hypothetical protein
VTCIKSNEFSFPIPDPETAVTPLNMQAANIDRTDRASRALNKTVSHPIERRDDATKLAINRTLALFLGFA